ncbi:hypothetical protein [Xylella fastidiosa]|uniref:Uncharacterized protein n=1 Tax=Xylella fastidiosa subsp. fastidiosa TaxID=644356 RepID=A0AAJ5UK30_XYLFS|nr:hypothetical protein [Xylella fastidiosa]WCF29634.1 hypothetical protein OK117_12620 [Xylella fastidiosa subsp. fastidiosa]
MSEVEVQTQVAKMTVGKGIGIYAALLVGFIVLVKLAGAVSWFSGSIPFFAYFVFGFIMNRVVLRGLIEWHPIYNTIENVSGSKLSALIFWPISYLALFFRLGVIKHL